jgi:hypothetical protein
MRWRPHNAICDQLDEQQYGLDLLRYVERLRQSCIICIQHDLGLEAMRDSKARFDLLGNVPRICCWHGPRCAEVKNCVHQKGRDRICKIAAISPFLHGSVHSCCNDVQSHCRIRATDPIIKADYTVPLWLDWRGDDQAGRADAIQVIPGRQRFGGNHPHLAGSTGPKR